MPHQLAGNLGGECRIQPALDVDGRQLSVLMLGILVQLLGLPGQIGAFGIRLRTDRYILAGRHRHGTSDKACDACDQDALGVRPCRGYAQDEACSGNYAVVCAKNSRA